MSTPTRWSLLTCFVLATGQAAAAGTGPIPAQRQVADAIHARIDAFNRRDVATFKAMAAEPYLGVGDDQVPQESVPDYSTWPKEYSQISDIRDLRIRVHGDTAVANYRTTEREPLGGIVLVSEERRSEAWQKQHGRWRLLQAHLALIPVNFREPVAGVPQHLDDYAGKYEVRADSVVTVTTRDARLFMVYTGESEPWEASYGGGDTFFFRQMAGDLTNYEFERDAAGRVTALLMHRPDGQTLRAPHRQ